ncbi:thioredoxin family protein [Massilia sp. 2TAF26]|uniref:thioredoxin family protein n=1 Tax=Massilia sp. 2TAF26 TaxID=3233012 RepID=UPI003F9E40AB
MKFRTIASGIVLAVLTTMAHAGQTVPYTQQAFDKLAKAGKPVVVNIFATWCLTSTMQKPIQESLLKSPKYKDVTLLTVNFDTQKPVVAKLKATMQGTLIAFKGGREVARSESDATPEGVEAIFKKSL